jgi:hypothetical protein
MPRIWKQHPDWPGYSSVASTGASKSESYRQTAARIWCFYFKEWTVRGNILVDQAAAKCLDHQNSGSGQTPLWDFSRTLN